MARYWVKERGEALTPAGDAKKFSCWGWSSRSRDEARRRARESAHRIEDRIRAGEGFPERYAYGDRPVREEILREIPEGSDDPRAVITRNAYGCQVLNAAGVLFVDRDESVMPLARLVRRLLGRDSAASAIRPAEAIVTENPGFGFRVYKTCAGLRYLATHALFEPGGAASERIMERLSADPRFVRLCRVQKSFRARLTPKPWRCGMQAPSVEWPWSTDRDESRMSAWQTRYQEACAGKAVCHLMATVGNAEVHPGVREVLDVHDQIAGVGSDLPLA